CMVSCHEFILVKISNLSYFSCGFYIIKLKARVKKLERLNKVKSSKLKRLKKVGTSQRIESSEDVENVFNQGRISVDMETNEGIELEVDQEKDAEVEGRQEDTQAEIYNIDLDHSSKVLTVSTRRRKGVVIRDPKEELHIDTPAETPTVKDKGKGILIKDPKPMKKKDQIELDTEFNANMKFLFKTREEMEKEDEEIIKSINETLAQKVAKRRKLSEEAQEADDLRGRLEIVQDKDDDVFIKAIPLAQKVSVVDYQAKVKVVQDVAAAGHAKGVGSSKLRSGLSAVYNFLDLGSARHTLASAYPPIASPESHQMRLATPFFEEPFARLCQPPGLARLYKRRWICLKEPVVD
nr:hypothetical protein [Tanacetum cinerariifolium]